MSEWIEKRLSDIIELIGGGTPKTSHEEYWNGDIPWLSVVDFNNDSRWVFKTEKSITQVGLLNSSTKLLDTGDLIISARGTVGALAQLNTAMALNQSCYGIKGKNGISNGYLYYLIKYHLGQLKRNVHGAVFDTITRETFDFINVRIPENTSEQDAIYSILDPLDRKISLLRRQNEILEEMAQAIFKHWFVDFEFPMSAEQAAAIGKPELEGKPYRSNGGKMVDSGSEFGEVPEGWTISKLGKLTKNKSINVSKDSINRDDLYIGLEHMPRNRISLDAWTFASNVESNKRRFHKGDILFGKLRPYFHKVGVAPISGICSTDILVINSNRKIEYGFALMVLSSEKFIKYVSQASEGTRMPRTNLNYMMNYSIILPTDTYLSQFNTLLQTFLSKLLVNIEQSIILSKIRDSLLPKLMSGEINL